MPLKTELRASEASEPREPERGSRGPATKYDVVVVGARCAGAATAMLLAREGRRVLLVDRGRYGSDTLSTHALMRGAVVQLHRWNILPAVIASGTTPVRRATFYYGDESVAVPIASRDGIEAISNAAVCRAAALARGSSVPGSYEKDRRAGSRNR